MSKKFLYIIGVFWILNGCTADDICPEDSPTTPLLIITFRDFINPQLAKEVTDLTLKTTDETPVVVLNRVTTDSIAIPLDTNNDFTKLFFIKNDNNDDTGNYDTVTFTYQNQLVYINRACGFINNYTALQANLTPENNTNWIQEIQVLQTEIKDETTTHITILH